MTETNGTCRRLGLLACVSSLATAACAADVPVGHEMSLKLGDGDRIVLDTTAVSDTLPSVGADPILWIDASDTTDWEFDETTGKPKKIPSKVGSRYLKSYKENGDAYSFQSGKYPSGATLVEGGLNGRAYLDFGAENSGSGYMLNPVLVSAGDTATTNWLGGIRTVIAVYGSQQGGGCFVFGGGFGSAANGTTCKGNGWQRGQDYKKESADYRSSVQVFNAGSLYAFWTAMSGYFDGVNADPRLIGFNGGWQVVSVVQSSTSTLDINAQGVGVNDISYNANVGANRLTGGGMKIAELVVYDQSLTGDQRKSIEAYLQRKWFNRTLRGSGGRAYAGRVHLFSTNVSNAGVAAGAEVPGGETLEVDEITGGRGTGCSFTKTGAGTLALGTSGDFHGTLKLAGGTLKMSPLDISAEMPCTNAIIMRLDTKGAKADNFETEVRDGVEYVTKWKNLAPNRKSDGYEFYGAQTDEARQPVLVDGMGGKVVDFGEYKTGGRCMNLSTSKTAYSNTALSNMGSLFVVLSSEFGGVLFGADNDNGSSGRVGRGAISGYSHPDTPIWGKGWPTWLNGIGINSRWEGQNTIGYHLLATQVPGVSGCGRIGAYNNAVTSGGMKIAEFVVYDHVLTEDEFRQAESAMMAKWFNRDKPGFPTKYDIDKLQVDAESTLYVPAGMTLRVRSLACSATLWKRGGGALQVDATSNTTESGIRKYLKVSEGAFRFVETDDVVDDASAPAGDPCLHLDPSVAGSVLTNADGVVTHWNEVGTPYANMLYGGNSPTNIPDAFGPGLGAVDFGGKTALNNYWGAYAYFIRPLENIRTLYFIAANMDLGGYFLGVKAQNDDNWLDDRNLLEFSRNGSKFLNTPDTYKMVTWAPMYRDGSKIDRNTVTDSSVHLYEIHATGNAYASAIARNNLGHITGGIRLGEMIAYDRPLTEREKTATRNYLMKKWLGRADLDPLPAKPEESTEAFFEEIVAEDGSSYEDIKGGNLVGDGAVSKVGDGTMEIRDLTGFSGALTVSGGTFKITGAPPPVEPAMPTSKPVMHLDASRVDTLTLTKDSSGVDRVTEWRSLTDNGWKAVPRATSVSSEKPKYMAEGELGGRPALRWAANWPGMSFRDADNTATQKIEKLYSALWIIGTHEGGGFLLGSGDTATSDWYHRGVSGYGGSYADALIYGAGGARTAEFYVNDTRMSSHSTFAPVTDNNQLNTGYPSSGWHFVSMRQGTTFVENEKTVSADGLAYCKNASYGRDGRQRLAEVAIYTNQLTAAECRAAGYYMRIKWGLITDMQRSQTNAAQIVVASGATLDLGGTNQYVMAVGGAGSVVNGGLTSSKIVADPSCSALTVMGAFTAAEPFTVEIRNSAGLPFGYYEILSAGSIVNGAAISGAALTGDGLPQGSKLRVRDGKVFVRLGELGMVILVK